MKKIIAWALVLCALAFVAIWQKNNITAIYMFLTKDRDQVLETIEANRGKLTEEIKHYVPDIPEDFTKEEEARIASGEITYEEAEKMMEERMEAAKNANEEKNDGADSQKKDGGQDDEKKAQKDAESQIIKKYVTKLYTMKAYYSGQLGQIESRARNEFASLSSEERKALSKASFVAKYAGYATSLLTQCDGEVSSLLSQMKAELIEVGGDTSVIATVKKAYENEKAAKKAYYLNMVG